MTETKEATEKTLRGAAPRKPLSLKRTVDAGHVKQSFSHGRSKSVVVEKKKKRTIAGPGGAEAEEAATPQTEADRLLAEVMERPGGDSGPFVAHSARVGQPPSCIPFRTPSRTF